MNIDTDVKEIVQVWMKEGREAGKKLFWKKSSGLKIFEQSALKQKVFRELDRVRKVSLGVDDAKDLKRAQACIKILDGPANAVRAFVKETGYTINPSTMWRINKGQAKPAMIAFIRYALENHIERDKSLSCSQPTNRVRY